MVVGLKSDSNGVGLTNASYCRLRQYFERNLLVKLLMNYKFLLIRDGPFKDSIWFLINVSMPINKVIFLNARDFNFLKLDSTSSPY